MNHLRRTYLRFRALFEKRRLDIDMDAEMRAHLEMQTRENLEAGMAPEEARYAALREFGWAESIKETCREQRGILWLEQFVQDVLYGLRSLRRSPGFTAAAVATLALGIGMNTVIFSIISAVLLRPLPYPAPEQLVVLNGSNRKGVLGGELGVSAPDYRDWRAMSRSFTHLGAEFYDEFWLAEGEQLRPVRGWYLSAEVLPALGVSPRLGRGFLEEDEKAGGVAVLGHDLWQRLFGSETNLAGKSIVVNTQRVQVIGVMPPGFNFPARTEMWLPLPESKEVLRDRGWKLGLAIGRLKPGVSLAQAQAEMDSIARRLEAQYPGENRDWGVRVTSYHAKLIAKIRPVLPILIGVAAFVLLIACANLGNLLLSRSLARQKELAIRAAVGAANGRLVRQLLTESLLISFMGAVVGLLAALCSRGLWSGSVGPHLPQFAVIRLDLTVGWFTLAVAVLTGTACGLLPAWRIWRTDPHETLKEGGQRSAVERRGGWLRSGLVVVQVSLALVLLLGAGVALRSVYYLLHPGLRVDLRKVLVMDLPLSKARYPEDTQRLEFFERLISRLNAWPTVEASGAATFVDFSRSMGSGITLEDRPDAPEAPTRWTCWCAVSPGFFKTIGVPLLQGRDLTAQDRKGAPEVALVNETMARRYWPGEDPIGKRFAAGRGAHHEPWITVVGVVRDLRPGGIESARRVEYYNSWYQKSFINTLVVRTTIDPAKMTGQIQALLRSLDKTLPAPEVQTLDALLDDVASDTTFLAALLGAFAGLALVLAVVGIYGVIAYTVTQRSHEFGVRMALGARQADIVLLVLKWGVRLALAGTALGLVAAWMLTRLMASLVQGVSPRDAATFLAVPPLLLAAALIGCYLPAHRASRVDPMSALRNE
ncbi:MAG TPA: ABC transporter permease [Dongiaceae bacterium]|nr:ABC transporter permease [Dongiaceae bacterium]